MASIAEKQQEIIDEFSFLEDWMDKYQQIIELGQKLPPLEDRFKTEEYRVQGCVSQVWLNARMEGDRLVFDADSDAAITKGLIALLVKVYSGHSPKEIIETPPRFIDAIGLSKHLTPNRSNGLVNMVKKIQALAAQHAPAA